MFRPDKIIILTSKKNADQYVLFNDPNNSKCRYYGSIMNETFDGTFAQDIIDDYRIITIDDLSVILSFAFLHNREINRGINTIDEERIIFGMDDRIKARMTALEAAKIDTGWIQSQILSSIKND